MFALRPSSSPLVPDPRRWRAPLVGPARLVGSALLSAAALLAAAPAAEAAPWVFHAQRDLKGLRLARPVGAEAGAAQPLAARVVFSHLNGVVADGLARLRLEYDLVADPTAATLVPTVCVAGGPCDRAAMRGGDRWVVLPLPLGTPAEAVALVGAGVEAVEHLTGDAAADVLSALAEGSGHGEAVALVGHPVLLARLPRASTAEPRFTLALEWTQAVAPNAEGWWGLSAPPGPSRAQGEGPLAVELQIAGTPAAPVRGVLSPSHAVEVVRGATAGHPHARVRFRGPAAAEPFELLWTQDPTPLGLRVLTHRAADGAAGEPGFLLALAQPEALFGADDAGADGGAEAADRGREVVLVVDASGSMRGEKWEQARGAIAEALDALGPADRFNVVLFGNEVASFAPAVLAASPDQVAAAQAWLEEQVPNGRTNLGGALTAALADLAPAAAGATGVTRDRLVVLLTDGAPTAGEVDPARILGGLAAERLARARVVAVGVGQDLDTWLLDQLATRTDGRVLYLDPEEDLDGTVAQLVGSLRAPVLDGVTARVEVSPAPGAALKGALTGNLGGALASAQAAQQRTYEINPPPPRTLFAGQEVLFTGRFPIEEGAQAALVIEGTHGGRPVQHRFALQPSAQVLDRRFIATLWASHRVAALLQHLRLKGHDEARAKELVELATRYGIVTEYTAFVVDAGGDLTEDNRKEAQDNVRNGLLSRSGSWAVNQARNEQSLMRRKVASHTVEAYRDRDGREQKAKVQRVGGRVFYKQADAWVETAASAPAGAGASGASAPKTPVRTVKRYSPEYFDLVKNNADFARAQRLDGDVRMQVGDALVEVK